MKRNLSRIYKITVGIPAFNEEANIKRLLKSLISQKLPANFQLEEIKVVSDGSTDKTADKVKSIKEKRLKLYNYSERLGKNARLNQLFKNLSGDILVLFDADTLISDQKVLANLTKPFSQIEKLGLVAGNAQPLEAKTLIEEAVNNFIHSLNFMKSRINMGNNIFSVRGPIIAMSKEFVGRVTLPLNVPDDRYLYLKCLQLGFNFFYSDKASVFFRSPQTLKDQINQGLRFLTDKQNLYKYFDSKLIDSCYFVPAKLKIGMLIFQILKNPFAYLTMKFIHLQILRAKNRKLNHKWSMVLSSKKLI